MKKNILMALLALSFSFVATVHAAAPTTGSSTSSFTVSPVTDCSLLSQSAKINLSADVVGAYKCDTASGIMSGATCHTAGGTKPVSATCSCVGTPDGAGGTTYTPSPATCTCDAGGAVTTAGGTVEVTGRKGYGGTTDGGSIGILPMSNGGAAIDCTTTTAEAILP